MLAASIAFGIQKMLISIGGYWPVSLVLTTAVLVWAGFHFRHQQPPALLSKICIILLMVRFAIPIVTIGTDTLSQKFLAADYATSQRAIDLSSDNMTALNPPVSTSSDATGIMEKMKGWFAKNGDVKTRFENLKKAAEQATDHIVRLMVIFLLQTVVIPLLLLWGLYAVVRGTFELSQRASNTPTVQ